MTDGETSASELLRDAKADVRLSPPQRLADGFRALDRFSVDLAGCPEPQDRDILRSGECVALIAVDPERDAVVMLRQFRLAAELATGTGELVEFVAGRLESGEDPLLAVRREALEEIGLPILGEPRRVLRFMPSPGITDEIATMFVGRVDSSAAPDRAGLAAENETTLPLVVGIDAALAALHAGTVVNAYTVMGLQWLALNRHRLREALDGRSP